MRVLHFSAFIYTGSCEGNEEESHIPASQWRSWPYNNAWASGKGIATPVTYVNNNYNKIIILYIDFLDNDQQKVSSNQNNGLIIVRANKYMNFIVKKRRA